MDFVEALKKGFSGEVRSDPVSKIIYSQDASLYEIEPLCVAMPTCKKDLSHIVEVASEFNLPVIPRGAATGTTGGCLGKGIIVDMSTYLSHIEKIDREQKWVQAEPGVIQDNLNAALFPYRLGPDTSTGNRATLGGMLANNAAGARSLRWGSMRDHILEVDLLLASGEILKFGTETESSLKEKAAHHPLYRTLLSLRDLKKEVEEHFPHSSRQVSGYDLRALMGPFPLNLARLIAGSEGTLGIITSMKLRIVERPQKTGLLALFLKDLVEAAVLTQKILPFHPLSLELLDKTLLEQAKKLPKVATDWIKTVPEAMLVVEVDGETSEEVEKKLLEIQNFLKPSLSEIFLDEPSIASVWDVRKKGLGILMSKRSYQKASAFFEDIAVPVPALPRFFPKLLALLSRFPTSIYGHIGEGCLHLRPYIDLGNEKEKQAALVLFESIVELIAEFNGALSGEHGDGLVRSYFNERMFGKKIYKAFQDLKNAFDPHQLMNPGKIVSGQHPLEHLRERLKKPIATTFDFSEEGGFDLSLELCNGNGLCRKKEGVMCPSFQATEHEIDTTRARANALKAMYLGKVSEEDIYPALDLCLQCKGCKTECPSQVDMAKMKPEYLHRLYQKKHRPLRDYLFGHLGAIMDATFPVASKLPFQKGVELFFPLLGITKKRPFPQLAKKRASQVFFPRYNDPDVFLFIDTFTEFFEPGILEKTFFLLQAHGFQPRVLPWNCCGRTYISKGMLPQAAKKAEKLLESLESVIESPFPILGLEPSCLYTLKDDVPSLVSKKWRPLAQRLQEKIQNLEEFFLPRLQRELFSPELPNVAFHTHCYQKSLAGTAVSRAFLELLFPKTLDIPSGCCGVAGSFGYEKEHFEISQKIGELVLLPKVRQLPEETWVIANGTSCRNQIETGTERKPLHMAEALFSALVRPPSPN